MQVVVVEFPAKAKTINKYLGPGYQVLASYGHVSDLPPKDGSVRPAEDFAMDWEVDAKAEKHIREIIGAIKNADGLILATDPDREGEAISWHVQRVLQDRKALHGMPVKRVVFNEITKSAILDAMQHPRDLDQELVDAYLARRALDYLVGFTLSPVLWRKLPGSRSAGRVQSVALRLICEREAEIEKFRAQEYWSLEADFLNPRAERSPPISCGSTASSSTSSISRTRPPPRMPRPRCAPPSSMSPASNASRPAATRGRPSPPRPCSRKPRASSASRPSIRCRSPSAFMRASTSAARRSA